MTEDLKGKQQIDEAAAYIRGQAGVSPSIGLILGSGLGVLADLVQDAKVIDFFIVRLMWAKAH